MDPSYAQRCPQQHQMHFSLRCWMRNLYDQSRAGCSAFPSLGRCRTRTSRRRRSASTRRTTAAPLSDARCPPRHCSRPRSRSSSSSLPGGRPRLDSRQSLAITLTSGRPRSCCCSSLLSSGAPPGPLIKPCSHTCACGAVRGRACAPPRLHCLVGPTKHAQSKRERMSLKAAAIQSTLGGPVAHAPPTRQVHRELGQKAAAPAGLLYTAKALHHLMSHYRGEAWQPHLRETCVLPRRRACAARGPLHAMPPKP